MKLPRHYFDNLSASNYREYLKLLPDLQHENTRIITTLIMTFTAMSIFGIFAINPTLSTIVNLRKQLADSTLVHEQLETKINNLNLIQQQLAQLNPDLPTVFDAIPKNAEAPTLMGQILTLVKQSNIQTTSLSVSEVQLTGEKKSEDKDSFLFSIQANGTYENLLNFTKELTQMGRLITIDSFSINKNEDQEALVLNLKGRGYYKN